MDHLISARRKNLVLINEKKMLVICRILLFQQTTEPKCKKTKQNKKIVESCQRAEKTVEMTVISIVPRAPGTVSEGLIKRLGELEIIRTHGDHIIVKFGLNTPMNPRNLRRLAFPQTLVKEPRLMKN